MTIKRSHRPECPFSVIEKTINDDPELKRQYDHLIALRAQHFSPEEILEAEANEKGCDCPIDMGALS